MELHYFTGNDSAELTINTITHKVELYTSSGWHFCLNIQPSFPIEAINSLFSTINLSQMEKCSVVARILRQFCHPSFEFLKKVLSVFNEVDHEFLSVLEKYCKNCDICNRYKPTIPWPAVGNLYDPSKLTFNSIVTVNLKEWKGKYIIYIIDLFSRYTQADFIQSKCKDVVSKIIELWFPVFGNLDMFLMDNGGEFGNDTMRELGNLFSINIKHCWL